jgi:LmbE family N-acetylglucosaminyl deacetylase
MILRRRYLLSGRLPAPARVLAIGAHPDDIELGCGGVLALLARARVHLEALVVTDGAGNGRSSAVRYAESRDAARLLGVSRVKFGRIRDGQAGESSDLAQALEPYIRAARPTLVLTHATTVQEHSDHYAVAAATTVACRAHHVPVLGYEGPTYRLAASFLPTMFVDIQDVWAVKRKAILAHRSEVRSPAGKWNGRIL